VSWDQRFFDPIVLPGLEPLVTLRDAALYITQLPKSEQDAEEWQAAIEALILVAEYNSDDVCAHRYDAGALPGPTVDARGAAPQARQGLQNYRKLTPFCCLRIDLLPLKSPDTGLRGPRCATQMNLLYPLAGDPSGSLGVLVLIFAIIREARLLLREINAGRRISKPTKKRKGQPAD
jgi:hypothetical protein